MVRHGQVRDADMIGDDFVVGCGRRYQPPAVADARSVVVEARRFWFLVVAKLQRYMIATIFAKIITDLTWCRFIVFELI